MLTGRSARTFHNRRKAPGTNCLLQQLIQDRTVCLTMHRAGRTNLSRVAVTYSSSAAPRERLVRRTTHAIRHSRHRGIASLAADTGQRPIATEPPTCLVTLLAVWVMTRSEKSSPKTDDVGFEFADRNAHKRPGSSGNCPHSSDRHCSAEFTSDQP